MLAASAVIAWMDITAPAAQCTDYNSRTVCCRVPPCIAIDKTGHHEPTRVFSDPQTRCCLAQVAGTYDQCLQGYGVLSRDINICG